MPLNAEYYYYGDTWNHSSFLCGFWIVTDIVVSTGSIWTLAVIALDTMEERLSLEAAEAGAEEVDMMRLPAGEEGDDLN